jgi:hypothetical protein
MTRPLRSVFVCLLPLLTFTTPARAQITETAPRSVQVGAEVVLTSRYVWRGMDDSTDPSLLPSFWTDLGPVRILSWSNLTTRAGQVGIVEHDLTVDYGRRLGALEVRGGFTHYSLKDTPDSTEVFATATREGTWSPTVEVFHDFRQGAGTYVSGALARTLPWSPRALEMEAEGAVGYNHHQWVDRSGFSDLTLTIRGTWQAGNGRVAGTPFLTRSQSLNRGIFPDRTFGGVAFVFE